MESWHYFHAVIVLKLAPHSGYTLLNIQKIPHRSIPEYYNHLWLHGCDFPKQEGLAHRCFFGGWRSIAGRPTPIDITNQNVFTFEPNSLDNFCQKLARASYERARLLILISPRRFTYKHQASTAIALSMDDVCSTLMKRASRAVSNVRPYLLETFG